MNINLPITSANPIGGVSSMAVVDCTPTSLPDDVCADKADHISVWVDGGIPSITAAEGTCVTMDLVFNVSVNEPSGVSKVYKIVKRLKLDKCKLAVEAEKLTPVHVIEAEEPAEDPLIVEAEMKAFYDARELRRRAGIQESAGTKSAKLDYDCDDEDGNCKSCSMVIKDIKDKAHARHVFTVKHAAKHKNPKIKRVTMLDKGAQ